MADQIDLMAEAAYIEGPCDPDIKALYSYWDSLRCGRSMPRRGDIDPTKIPKVLPHVFMYNVAPGGAGYTIRLAGEEVLRFMRPSAMGLPAGSALTPRGAEMILKVLDAVTTECEPKFRAGKTFWHPDHTYRDFEACFLPLSPDDQTVNIVIGAVKLSA